jgi:hypothetical protein
MPLPPLNPLLRFPTSRFKRWRERERPGRGGGAQDGEMGPAGAGAKLSWTLTTSPRHAGTGCTAAPSRRGISLLLIASMIVVLLAVRLVARA